MAQDVPEFILGKVINGVKLGGSTDNRSHCHSRKIVEGEGELFELRGSGIDVLYEKLCVM